MLVTLYPLDGGDPVKVHPIDAGEILRAGHYTDHRLERDVAADVQTRDISTDGFDSMSKTELKEYADANEIPVDEKWNRSRLINEMRGFINQKT